MFSDKTKKYRLADSKSDFIRDHLGKKEFVKQFSFWEVLFVQESDDVFAFINKCPHQGAKLNGCKLEQGKIICPVHQYRFDAENGLGHGMYLDVYPFVENADGFFLLRTYFSWFGE